MFKVSHPLSGGPHKIHSFKCAKLLTSTVVQMSCLKIILLVKKSMWDNFHTKVPIDKPTIGRWSDFLHPNTSSPHNVFLELSYSPPKLIRWALCGKCPRINALTLYKPSCIYKVHQWMTPLNMLKAYSTNRKLFKKLLRTILHIFPHCRSQNFETFMLFYIKSLSLSNHIKGMQVCGPLGISL